jgi:hypothetical protein
MKNEKRHPTVEEMFVSMQCYHSGGTDRQEEYRGRNAWVTNRFRQITRKHNNNRLKLKRSNNMKPQNILNLIGNTPLVESVNLVKTKRKITFKARREQSWRWCQR